MMTIIKSQQRSQRVVKAACVDRSSRRCRFFACLSAVDSLICPNMGFDRVVLLVDARATLN